MKDLTQGSIAGHVISLAVPTAAGMLFQTLYFFVDLYFVAELGDAPVAGVSAAGNIMFIVVALTQVLGVGTVALISHAVGRKDQQDANLVFNQSLLIAALSGLIALVGGYWMTNPYLRLVAADEQTIAYGRAYLFWFLPGVALQFAMVAMASALRGTGIVKPTMIVQVLTVLINTALAPVLIAGWGTGRPLGVAGAGLASTIAIVVGVALLSIYFFRLEKYVSFHPEQWQPRLAVWKRMFTIGLPAGGEFALLFVYTGLTYWAIRDFGAAAQAGFGIGTRIMQGIFLPAMAIAFVVAPIAGQNFGARRPERVRETFRVAATQSVSVMLVLMVLCQWQPEALVSFFTKDLEVIRVGALFLHLISWNFVMSALIFTCSGVFQALGNTVPALLSSASRIVVYALPLMWVTARPGYKIEHVWYLSIAASAVQTALSFTLLRKQMRLRLGSPASQPA
ncbi:MAG TPA: MATE family efflux transporter [Steroidobacter sp.]|uniref:MATE family efflux transporter n=1 Tax=Steroidobacter sp. TaxID=1978227 RepID=UPI002EDB4D48